MGDVTSKLRLFLFISIICLLINLSICGVSYAYKSDQTITTGESSTTLEQNQTNITVPMM